MKHCRLSESMRILRYLTIGQQMAARVMAGMALIGLRGGAR